MKRALTLVACGLLVAGCSLLPKPKPPEPPPAGPECHGQPFPEPQCAEGQAYECWHCPPDTTLPLYACPVYDSSRTVVGVINVTGGPAQCPAKPDAPPPTPTCPAQCPAGSHCTDPAKGCVLDTPPPPTSGTNCDGDPGAPTGQTTSAHGTQVNLALSNLTGCSIGSDCNLGNTTQQTFLRAVVDALRVHGICAGQHEPNVTDEIAVSDSPTGIREGYHVFAGDDSNGPVPVGGAPRKVVWSPGAARPAYFAGSTPPPEPPTSGGCTAPLPPKVWTADTLPDGWGENEIGKPRWEIGCNAHGNIVDCTAKVAPQACDYCAAIGMSPSADGQLRCGCPVRSECPGFKCEERAACEQYLSGGTKLESQNGATCSFANNNPWQFHPSNGGCRLCSVGDGRVCGGWF